MISINYIRNKSIVVEGHSGSAPAGKDLICAAVSALTYALDVAAAVHPAYNIEIKRIDKIPYFKASTGLLGRKALRTVAEGLMLLADKYPDFINFYERS